MNAISMFHIEIESVGMTFCHEVRSVNGLADAFAKQGIDKSIPW